MLHLLIAAAVTLAPLAASADPGQQATSHAQPAAKEGAKDGGAKEKAAGPTGLAVGDEVPEATLADMDGKSVKLSSLHKDKPLVLIFYRGGWCPFCNRQLSGWQGKLGELEKAGATLAAVSIEKPAEAAKMIEKDKLTYTVLVDETGDAVRAFKLVFQLDDATITKYKGYGVDLEKHNATGKWELPITSTYVIGTDGKIAYADNSQDYKKRADPDDVIAAVKKVTGK